MIVDIKTTIVIRKAIFKRIFRVREDLFVDCEQVLATALENNRWIKLAGIIST
ncbi:hypothetical protein NIES267_60280 [Calothrix parasitica NIES-267]|uniref:Uncharacterized protein n=1 Tax=Calothrix parasitica NIES-267 TaxID=1973488 RepID=A0A1Z4LZH4_9CYAN|nr:hypothetical protein NIES267_60280 [Calothrix parasitica NIES-267]